MHCVYFFNPSHILLHKETILTLLLFQNMTKLLGDYDELDIFVDGDENKSRLVKQLSRLSVEDGSQNGGEEMVRHRTNQR